MRSLRDRARPWVIALAVTAAVIGTLWATGGLDRATANDARRVAPGETIELTRWDLTVDACEVQLPAPDSFTTEARLVLRGTSLNTWDETQFGLSSETVIIELPGGAKLGTGTDVHVIHRNTEMGGAFDPSIPTSSELVATFDPALWKADATEVLVRFASEYQRDGYLLAGTWVPNVETANLRIPCTTQEAQ